MIWFSLLGRENRETRLCGYGLHIYFEVIERGGCNPHSNNSS